MESKAAITSLSALAHDGRLAIFRLLVKAGPEGMAAGDIGRALETPPSTMSASFNVLSQAGLVTSRRLSRSIIYAANYDGMTELLSFLMEDCCAGSPQICAPLTVIASQCCAADGVAA
jgi:ArsR family transcriptional regulator